MGFKIENGVLEKYTEERGVTEVVIPDGVTSIGYWAFQKCGQLTGVTLPDGVTSIGSWAFYECKKLTSIRLPDGVTSIGEGAFWECGSLASITIPDSVTSVGARAFAGCKKLDLTLPAGLTAVGEAAFRDCALTSITIPAGVTKIGRDAFLRCGKIETAGPAGGGYDYEFSWTEKIPDNAFSGLRKLKTAVLPATIQKVGSNAFRGCRELVDLTMPKTAKVSRTAFKDCAQLGEGKVTQTEAAAPDVKAVSSVHPRSGKEAPLPDFVMINGRLLRYNGHKKKVVIPDGTTVISKRAFYCGPITSVTIPASVRTVEQEAFHECWNLKSITILGQIEKVEADALDWNEPEQALPVFSSIPLRALTNAAQNKAIPAFDKCFSQLDPKSEVVRDDLKFIGTHLKRSFGYSQGFKYLVRNDALRRAVLDAKAIPAKDIEWLVAQIQPERYPETVAALLDYKNRLLKDPKVKRSLERAKSRAEEKVFSLEMTVADWRKIFRFSYVDGGIVIRETRAWDDVVTVPARIGTKNVRTIAAGVFCFLGDGGGQEAAPPKRIVISEGIQEICTNAFTWVNNAEVFIPRTVTSLPAGTFVDVQNLIVHLPASMTEIAEDVCWESSSPIRAIHAPAGSCAERYAKKHNIPFVVE